MLSRYDGSQAHRETPKQSNHRPLVTETINDGIDLFDVKSTAQVTYASSRRYDLPIVFEGCLMKPSTNRLVNSSISSHLSISTGRSKMFKLIKLVELFNYYAPRQLKDRDGKVIRSRRGARISFSFISLSCAGLKPYL